MLIAGFDEVGRGAWAGPLVVAGVVLDSSSKVALYKDSKAYTRSQRALLSQEIKSSAVDFSIQVVDSEQVDKIGLTAAHILAFTNCYMNLRIKADNYIVDGNVNYLKEVENKSSALVKADIKVNAVAAASILAKVYRDELMINYSGTFPEYNFDSNVGYGTRKHHEALKAHGPCGIHRMSFKPLRDLM